MKKSQVERQELEKRKTNKNLKEFKKYRIGGIKVTCPSPWRTEHKKK